MVSIWPIVGIRRYLFVTHITLVFIRSCDRLGDQSAFDTGHGAMDLRHRLILASDITGITTSAPSIKQPQDIREVSHFLARPVKHITCPDPTLRFLHSLHPVTQCFPGNHSSLCNHGVVNNIARSDNGCRLAWRRINISVAVAIQISSHPKYSFRSEDQHVCECEYEWAREKFGLEIKRGTIVMEMGRNCMH